LLALLTRIYVVQFSRCLLLVSLEARSKRSIP